MERPGEVRHLYNYITGGVFLELTDADLLEKPARTPRKKNEEPKVAHPKARLSRKQEELLRQMKLEG